MSRRLAAFLLALTIAVPVGIAGPAHASTAAFVKVNEWSTGYVGQFTVTNDTATPMTWRVEFDLPAGTTVVNAWSAQLTRTGDHYVVVGAAWNATVAAGASTTFGWVAQGTGGPVNCRLNGGPCTGGTAVDIRPPKTPGNLRTEVGTGTLTLRWNPSTDDVAVTGYEVYIGSNLVATVTGTTYTMPTPPPAIFTYRVRALDAAGNASPYAMITPGGPPDTTAPTAPTGLGFGSGPGGLTLTWTAATDNVGVAGYTVTVNGERLGATSHTRLTIPPIGFGEFTFTIVAFDGAGLTSTPLTRMVAVDPGPTSDARQPTPPTNLLPRVTPTQVSWSWTASTDNVGVAGYEVFQGTEWVTTVTGTSFTEPRVPGQTTYGIRVRAFDAIGNKSAFATLTIVID
jgi:hypothetical protein